MTLREALSQAILESQKIVYDTDEQWKYYWNTPTETRNTKKGNCADASIIYVKE